MNPVCVSIRYRRTRKGLYDSAAILPGFSDDLELTLKTGSALWVFLRTDDCIALQPNETTFIAVLAENGKNGIKRLFGTTLNRKASPDFDNINSRLIEA